MSLRSGTAVGGITVAPGGSGMRSGRPTPEVYPPPESLRPTVYGERYVVSAGHPLVAGVTMEVFDRGGSAIDAGVAGALAATVVQPDMCNLGGVAPITVRAAGEECASTIAGLGWWGQTATVEAFRARFGDDMPLGPPVGVVPAAASAFIRTLQRFGTWSFATCAAPAIALAREGFVLDERLAQSFEIMGRGFSGWPSSKAIYWPNGRPPRPGERLVQEALGRTLQRLADAEAGAPDRETGLDAVHDAFYRGDIAHTIAQFSDAHDGWLTAEDLAGFEAEIAPGVRGRFADWDIWTPTTWCQGPALLQALAIIDAEPVRELGHNSLEYVHFVAEAIKLAFLDRERYYGDPRFVDVPLDRLLSAAYAQECWTQINRSRARPGLGGSQHAGHGRLDTTYLCAIDAAGNAFSAMPSDTLDGSPIIPELGLMISPRGVQSRLDPAHPACLAPGKRPRMTPAPAIALRDRQPNGSDRQVMALGCPGGDVILQAMLQAFLNVTVFEMTAQQAVEAPRFAAFAWPDSFYPHGEVPARVSLEGRFPQSVSDGLRGRGHDVVSWPDYEFDAGGVSLAYDAAVPNSGRVLVAGADPRRSGYALGR